MTHKEIKLLKVNKTTDTTNIEINIGRKAAPDNAMNEYYIRLGDARYYNFGEALALLNDLEKHAQ